MAFNVAKIASIVNDIVDEIVTCGRALKREQGVNCFNAEASALLRFGTADGDNKRCTITDRGIGLLGD